MKKKSVMSVQPVRPEGPAAYFTSSKGQRFYAVDYGYKCWPIGKQGRKKK
ncbi:MAG: hypothetical protein JWL69_4367 [Phycisphaerales bacterium]|nr:hypothetical protein [Phycisphaerales bacterium]